MHDSERENFIKTNKALEIKFRNTKKLFQYKILILEILVILLLSLFVFSQFTEFLSFEPPKQDNKNPVGIFNSKNIVENLMGDTITTFRYWELDEGESLTINILNSQAITDRQIQLIKNAIKSKDVILVDNSLIHRGSKGTNSMYYVGWESALHEAAKKDTKLPIPKTFDIKNSIGKNGDVIIHLSNIKDSDGFTGYTQSTIDGDKIVRAFITIYEANSLTDEQFSTIFRHEFGHALGLGHSTAPDDLMAPTIDMTYPYISQCNILAISNLYNKEIHEKTVCTI